LDFLERNMGLSYLSINLLLFALESIEVWLLGLTVNMQTKSPITASKFV
jgi:hypothetical protein